LDRIHECGVLLPLWRTETYRTVRKFTIV
jgi:hypothetical protein